AAILYQQRCLYPQVRSTIAQFDREYLPMRDQMKSILQADLPLGEYWRMLSAGDSRLPPAVQHQLQKNERVSAMRAYLEQLDREAARVRAEPGLAGSALKDELLDAIARQKELSAQLAGKFVQGRLADMVRLIDVLQGDRELIAFETTKGEKEMLETRFDADELIEDLKVIIPRMPEGDRRADLYFQLAELWWEKARYAGLQEVRDHDDAVAKWADKREGEEPKLDTSRSDGYRREAIGLYQEVLDRYPAYERRDEVLFVAGHNLYESGNRDRGIAYYSALIAQYPKSRFVPDAWVQTGEHFFATNDLPRAREAFEKAASFHLPKLYAFALYKLAWCD